MPSHYYIDIPIILILIFSFIHGYRKGLLSFVVPFVAIIAAFLLFPIVNIVLSNSLAIYTTNIFLKILSLILLYIVLRLIFEKFKNVIENILKVIFLQWINKLIGGFLIAFISMFIVWVIYVLLAFVVPNNPLELNSVVLNYITSIVFSQFDVYQYI